MRKYIYIGIGGAAGAVLRYLVKGSIDIHGSFNWDTLLINTLGCFLLALFMTVALELMDISSYLRLGIATGLLGAFTTFSTVCKEAGNLILNRLYADALVYVGVSLILGIAAVFIGIVTARGLISIKTRSDSTDRREKDW